MLSVKVWGELACFTRPESKVERVSYPVMTPSAARGILEAIYWRHGIRWEVREIWVLNPINYFSIMTNEVENIAKPEAAMEGSVLVVDKCRVQRHTLALRDVSYIIKAEMKASPELDEPINACVQHFCKAISVGSCRHTPSFGLRELVAYFSEPEGSEMPQAIDQTLGMMIFDTYRDIEEPEKNRRIFFEGQIEKGVLRVPGDLYDQLWGD